MIDLKFLKQKLQKLAKNLKFSLALHNFSKMIKKESKATQWWKKIQAIRNSPLPKISTFSWRRNGLLIMGRCLLRMCLLWVGSVIVFIQYKICILAQNSFKWKKCRGTLRPKIPKTWGSLKSTSFMDLNYYNFINLNQALIGMVKKMKPDTISPIL